MECETRNGSIAAGRLHRTAFVLLGLPSVTCWGLGGELGGKGGIPAAWGAAHCPSGVAPTYHTQKRAITPGGGAVVLQYGGGGPGGGLGYWLLSLVGLGLPTGHQTQCISHCPLPYVEATLQGYLGCR